MSELVTYRQDGEIAIITIENPPVNALSPGVPEGIREGIERAAGDPRVEAVVVIGGGRTFIAGADIREFGKMTSGEKPRRPLHPLLNTIEDCPKPVVMAIHGTAFGGGLEVAMSGHYRVAVPGAQVGQPEVKLGIIPGAAGTQRLPRLAGVPMAIEMCAYGEPVPANAAHAAGIVDALVEGDLLAGALAFARSVKGRAPSKVRERSEKLRGTTPELFEEARKAARKKLRGQPAAVAAIDAIEAATRLPFTDGCDAEGELFQKCLHSEQSKALIHAFFGERLVSKIPGLPEGLSPLEIKRAAVIGAGTMGGGIAMVYANAGIPVLLREVSQDALDRGLATIRKNYAGSVKKGRLTQEEMDRRMGRITPVLSWDGFDQADIIVEAVFENMALKKQTFTEIDKVAAPGCILASNTSTLDVDEIASATRRPHMVIGHHFFSPANVMRLLEIVRGKATDPRVIVSSMELAKRLRKVGVLVGNCRGFVGNRMVAPYGREAVFMVEEGAAPEQVDQALYDWGMAMGPLRMGDMAGLDVGWRIRREFKHLEVPGVRYPEGDSLLCERGWFGQKTGVGWYRYDEQRNATPNPEAIAIVREHAAQAGIPQRGFTSEEIVERTIYALVNEGAWILEEGMALRANDIDIIYLCGYGFPAWRGGPMWYADTVGLKRVHDKVCELAAASPHHWNPAPLLKKLAEEGGTFAAWDKAR